MTESNRDLPPIELVDEEEEELEKAVLTRLMYMNATLTGLVTGLVFGGGVFLATNFLLLKGGPVIGPHLALLGQYFIGYTVTFTGSLIGAAYGFVSGFGIGYLISVIYNWLTALREKRNG